MQLIDHYGIYLNVVQLSLCSNLLYLKRNNNSLMMKSTYIEDMDDFNLWFSSATLDLNQPKRTMQKKSHLKK